MASLNLPDLTSRVRHPEIMDGPGLDPAEHARPCEGSGGSTPSPQRPALAADRAARPRAAGIAAPRARRGHRRGRVPATLARLAARAGLDVRVEGCDVSPRAVGFARERAGTSGLDVRFFQWDALNGALPAGYDVITSTLFLHHLDDAAAVNLLRRMGEAAGRAVLVDDLVRSRRGFALAWAGCRLLSGSRVVHHDGPVSVAAAFTPGEAIDLARRAGLDGATVTRHWPQRFLLAWRRP